MKKQLKAISACLLSALLATTALPFSKVEAKSKWVRDQWSQLRNKPNDR